MNRRDFLRMTAGLPVAAWGLSSLARAQTPAQAPQVKDFAPRPGPWRTFEITTHVEVQRPSGVTRLWVPLPGVVAEYQNPLDNHWTGNAALMEERTDPKGSIRMLYAEFPEGGPAPELTVSSRVQARGRAVDWSKTIAAPEDRSGLERCLAPTALIPTDGIVLETSRTITRGQHTDVAKARAVYNWILATMYREPKVRGCGVGDIKAILETKNFGGKCADINALCVGLLRASGVPARDVYGIRVAPSEFGYKTLGAASATITKSQHCRAEVFLREHGWVAIDPADVAKVAREETGEPMPLDDPLVAPVRRQLFGAWEGNWIGFNTAHDVALPNAAKAEKLAFLMYPQGETAEGRLDPLDADSFKYSITTRELSA
jgi:transglutaminase-like putative cysteine protease